MNTELDTEYYFKPTNFIFPQYTYKVTIGGNYGLVISVEKPPCAFHRLMQSLILGFKWEKLPTNEK